MYTEATPGWEDQRRGIAAVAAVVAVLLFLGIAGVMLSRMFHTTAAPVTPMSIQVVGKAVPGAWLTVYGSGFPTGARVVVSISRADVPRATTRAVGPTGVYRISFRVPAGERIGQRFLAVSAPLVRHPIYRLGTLINVVPRGDRSQPALWQRTMRSQHPS